MCLCARDCFCTLPHSSCFWDSITSRNDHVIFVCHLNAYLLFDAQPTWSSNCQAVRPAFSHRISLSRSSFLSFALFVCILFHSFGLRSSAVINGNQFKRTKPTIRAYLCVCRANINAKRRPQPKASQRTNKPKEGQKDETNHLNSVPHWIISHSGVGTSAFERDDYYLPVSARGVFSSPFVVAVDVDADAVRRFNFPLKSIWKWKIYCWLSILRFTTSVVCSIPFHFIYGCNFKRFVRLRLSLSVFFSISACLCVCASVRA